MVHIGKSTQKLAKNAGFSFNVQSEDGFERVQVYRGTAQRGPVVGYAVTLYTGMWRASVVPRGAVFGGHEIGVFPTIDDALTALMLGIET